MYHKKTLNNKLSKSTFLHHSNYILLTCTFHSAITNRRLNYIQHAYNHNQSSKLNHHTRHQCAHLLLWCLLTKDHRELIRDILLNSHHITLNTNTQTCLSPNQTHWPTLPDITIASADLHDCTSWQTIHSLTSDHLFLLTTLSIHHKTKTTHSHFTKTTTNYQKANWTSFKQHLLQTPQHKCS